jgi:two-component system sensor histidine kinase BaeS
MFGVPAATTSRGIAWTWILVAAVAALAVATVAAWWVTRQLTAPLVRIAGVAHAFAAGDRTVRVDAAARAAPGEIGDLARSFDSTADAVVASDHARQAMAADLAHELRTPLAALQAGLEELADGLAEPDAETLGALHAQSVRLGRLVGDVSQLAADATGLTLRIEEVDLEKVVAEAVAAVRPALERAGLAVAFAPVAQTGAVARVTVAGDTDRLHQCVVNLLVNAERHCRAGDLVEVTVREANGFGEVAVADNGPGIPEADLPRIFERLWRGDADSTGSGIGLAVVRHVVVAHGGTVWAESSPEAGTTVAFTIPAAPPRDDAPIVP